MHARKYELENICLIHVIFIARVVCGKAHFLSECVDFS